MTHERVPGDEPNGPERDYTLPAAEALPVASDPDELDPVMPPEFFDLPSITDER